VQKFSWICAVACAADSVSGGGQEEGTDARMKMKVSETEYLW